jgi:hypothetical protein
MLRSLLIALILPMSAIMAIHESMNFILHPSKRECFYDDLSTVNEERAIDIFVNSGGFLDIMFYIYGPLTVEEIKEEKFESPIQYSVKIDAEIQENSPTQTFTTLFRPKVEGSYAFCVDNRSAKFITKLVEVTHQIYSYLSTHSISYLQM